MPSIFSGRPFLTVSAFLAGAALAGRAFVQAQKFGAEIDRFGVSTGALDLNA